VKLIAILLLAAATIFADENPPQTPEVVDALDAVAAISARMHFEPDSPYTGPEDGLYVAPTQALIEDFLRFYEAKREQIPWLPEVFDCDDKATEMKYLAAVWSVRKWHGEAPGVLIGKAYVKIDGDYSALAPASAGKWAHGYHVLNFVVRSDGEVFFIEPQTGCVAEVSSFIYEGSIEILRLEY
jgi:hypothetical protein